MLTAIVHQLQRLGKAAYGGKWTAECDAELLEDRLELERYHANREALSVRSEKHLEDLVARERRRIDELDERLAGIDTMEARLLAALKDRLDLLEARLRTLERIRLGNIEARLCLVEPLIGRVQALEKAAAGLYSVKLSEDLTVYTRTPEDGLLLKSMTDEDSST